jgi:hypothetical protein
MNITKLIDLIFNPIEKALKCVGSIINQSPSKDEIKSLKTSPLFKSTYPHKSKSTFEKTSEHDHKRDHKAKGSVNTDSQIFNKPRK